MVELLREGKLLYICSEWHWHTSFALTGLVHCRGNRRDRRGSSNAREDQAERLADQEREQLQELFKNCSLLYRPLQLLGIDMKPFLAGQDEIYGLPRHQGGGGDFANSQAGLSHGLTTDVSMAAQAGAVRAVPCCLPSRSDIGMKTAVWFLFTYGASFQSGI